MYVWLLCQKFCSYRVLQWLFAQRGPFGCTPLLRCCLMCVVRHCRVLWFASVLCRCVFYVSCYIRKKALLQYFCNYWEEGNGPVWGALVYVFVGVLDGDYVSQLPYVWYYVDIKISFQYAREKCQDNPYSSCIMHLCDLGAWCLVCQDLMSCCFYFFCYHFNHHRVIKLVSFICPRISLLYRWNSWGHPMSRAVQEGCIASCVRYFLLPNLTHTWCLLRSTPISVSVFCCMWILYVVDLDTCTFSMGCHILLLCVSLRLTVTLCGVICNLLSHSLHRMTLEDISTGFTLHKKTFLDFSLLSAESEPQPDVGWGKSASKYRSSTLDGLRHHVTALHALFSSVFSFWTWGDLVQTGAAYSATK